MLVANGAMLPEAMDRERITAKELFSEMHRVGLTERAQVRWAILETSGMMNIMPQPDALTYVGNAHAGSGRGV